MKIYTKGGDQGQTSLVGGTRVSKTHGRIEAYGTVDELNAWLGRLRDFPEAQSELQGFLRIQEQLFTMGSNLALEEPGKFEIPALNAQEVEFLEEWIDRMDKDLPAMRNFVLPGGHPSVSTCHIARTVCRRAERQVLHMADTLAVEAEIIRYLNRLSDFLFILSRKWTQDLKVEERPWQPKK